MFKSKLYISPADANLKKEQFLVGTLKMCLDAGKTTDDIAPFYYRDKYEVGAEVGAKVGAEVGAKYGKRTCAQVNDNDNDDSGDYDDSESESDCPVDGRNLNEGKAKLYIVYPAMIYDVVNPQTVSSGAYYVGTRNMCVRYLSDMVKEDSIITPEWVYVYRLNIDHSGEFDHTDQWDLAEFFFDMITELICQKCDEHKYKDGKKYCRYCLLTTANVFCETCGVFVCDTGRYVNGRYKDKMYCTDCAKCSKCGRKCNCNADEDSDSGYDSGRC